MQTPSNITFVPKDHFVGKGLSYGCVETPFGRGVFFLHEEKLLAFGVAVDILSQEECIQRLREELGKNFVGSTFAPIPLHVLYSWEDLLKMPCRVPATPFEQTVWFALLAIEEGSTSTYQEIARKIGDEKKTRAVARAIGTNPLSYWIPCHRVIGKDGSLRGYRWGLSVKKTLLDAEITKEEGTKLTPIFS